MLNDVGGGSQKIPNSFDDVGHFARRGGPRVLHIQTRPASALAAQMVLPARTCLNLPLHSGCRLVYPANAIFNHHLSLVQGPGTQIHSVPHLAHPTVHLLI